MNMKNTLSELNGNNTMSSNQKLFLESNEYKVLRISSSNIQFLGKYPNNEEGRTFLLSNCSGTMDFIVSNHPLDIGLYIHSISDDTEYQFIPFDKLNPQEINTIEKTYSALTRNIINKLITGNINFSIQESSNYETENIMVFELVQNELLDYKETIYGFEDVKTILKDNNLILKSKKVKKLKENILFEMQNQVANLADIYIKQILKNDQKDLKQYKSAETQNYQEAIDNLHELFEKSKFIHDGALKKNNKELIKDFCRISNIDTLNIDYLDINPDLNIEEVISEIGDLIGFRHRRISLKQNWYKQSHGNLICISNSGHLVIAQEIKPSIYKLVDNSENLTFDDIQAAYAIFKAFPEKLNLNSLLNFAMEGRKGDLYFLIFTAVSAVLLGFIPPMVLGKLLNDVVPSSDLSYAFEFAGLLVVVSLGIAIFNLTKSISKTRLETLLNNNVQSAVWDRVLKIKPKFFSKYSPGELVDRINNISEIRELLAGTATDTLLNGIFGFLHLILMYSYSPKLTFPAIFVVLIIVIVTIGHRFYLRKFQKQLIVEEAKLKGFSGEIVEGIMKVKTSGFQNALFRKYVDKYKNRTELSHACETVKDSNQALNVVFNPLSTVIIYWVLVGAIFDPQQSSTLTLGAYFSFNASFAILLTSVTELAEQFTETFGEVEALYSHTKDIFEAPLENIDGEFINVKKGSIEFKKVFFQYDNSKTNVFTNINFELKPGTSLSIVGPTSSGKTTIARLLLGFENPSSGSIIISDYDIKKVNIKSLRSSMAAVMQGSKPSAGSIYDFISSGIQVNQKLFNEVINAVNLEKIISDLPMGWHTLMSENGSNFSIAEQSKFLIARTLLTEPKILILDDFLNKLERKESQFLLEYLKGKSITLITISQDVNLAKITDKILVLEEGNSHFGNYYDLLGNSKFLTNLEKFNLF